MPGAMSVIPVNEKTTRLKPNNKRIIHGTKHALFHHEHEDDVLARKQS